MADIREIDEAILQVEKLYKTLTGRDAPASDVPYAPIPPEREPESYVDEQLNRLFAQMQGTMPMSAQIPQMPWMPAISVLDGPDEITVFFDLSGVTRETIEVFVEQNTLHVTGERPTLSIRDQRQRLVLNERPSGAFRRAVPLPFGTQTDQILAHMKEGVLEVHIPRAPQGVSAQKVPVH